MRYPKIKCRTCLGNGTVELPPELKTTLLTLRGMGTTTIGALAKQMGIELSNAHHRVQRMIRFGVAKRVQAKMPATYRAV